MTSPISSSCSAATPVSASASAATSALRRQLPREINAIRDVLDQYTLGDFMTLEIREWFADFTADLDEFSDEIEGVCNLYITRLQETLLDPITTAPINDPVLGSDGYTYEIKSLYIYQRTLPPQYHTRSPMNPSNPTPFALINHRDELIPHRERDGIPLTIHPVVYHLLQWLEKHDGRVFSRELEAKYQQMVSMQSGPKASTEERMRQLIATQALRDQQEIIEREREEGILDERIQKFSEQTDQDFIRIVNQVQQTVTPLHTAQREITALERQEQAEIDGLNDRVKVFAQNLLSFKQDAVAYLHSIEETNQRLMRQVVEMQNSLETEIVDLKKDRDRLQSSLGALKVQLEDLKQREVTLQQSIIDVKIAIKKRKKRLLKDILETAAVVTATIFATYMLEAALQGTNFSGMLKPHGKGAKLQLKYNF